MSSRRHLRRCAFVLMCMGLGALEAAAAPLNDYKRALAEYFGAVGFHPLLLPQGHRVGDVLDIETLAVVREQETCFPGLRTERSDGNLSLPSVMELKNRAASFWIGLMRLVGLEIGADDTRRVLLNLQDVSVESASLDALQNVLDDQCSELEPLFEDNRMARAKGRRVNVIAAILRGRTNTVFSYERNVQVDVILENLATLLGDASTRLRKLSPELETAYDVSGRVNVIDMAERVQTVAYQPAKIFRPRYLASVKAEIDVEPFDPENKVHLERLRSLARAWAARPEVGE